MKKKLLGVLALCAACLVWGAQAQGSDQEKQGSSSSDPYSGSSSGQSGSGWQSGHMGATGRMSHQDLRATKITGATINSASGQELGTINDLVVNPGSGRVDFAVVSLSSSSGAGNSGTSGSSNSGQLVAVPWSLLRPSGMGGANTPGSTSTTSTSGSEQQYSFTYTGDTSKLQNAPSFSENSWPDISQPSWRHSVYSYYGMSAGAATGGATSPGGTGSSGSTTPNNP